MTFVENEVKANEEKQVLISVIIPTLNCADTIRDILLSVFSNGVPREHFEVLIIDYHSNDGTLEIAKEFPARMLTCEERGIGSARNLGIREAKGEILCFTDSDCVVENDWLAGILKFFESNAEVDGVGGPTLAHPKPWNKMQKLTGEIFVEDHRYPTTTSKVRFGESRGVLFGTNSAYRENALVSIGGFTKGGSCPELSWRLVANGISLIFEPSLIVYHRLPGSLRRIIKEQLRWGVQMTSMQRRHGVFKVTYVLLKGYFLTRLLLSLLVPRNCSKKLLRFTQLLAFSLGCLVGMRIIDYL